MCDTIALGVASGLVGNIAKDISNFLIYRAGGTEMLYGHFASSMFSPPQKVQEPGHFALGQILDFAIGATLGVPLVYLLKKTGKDHHLIKGAGMGLLLWGVLYGVGPNLKLLSIKPTLPRTHFSALWNNFVYGITTAQAAV